ncbi:unnamed protein product [Sphagnum balticum]
MSWESMLPMAVISAMIFVMANSQDVINKFTTGKPKHPRNDAWDRAMDERDARIKEEATRAHQCCKDLSDGNPESEHMVPTGHDTEAVTS